MPKTKYTTTEWMLIAVKEAQGSKTTTFPAEFLIGLRGALESGLGCDQIISLLVLATGLYEAMDDMDGHELVMRSVELTRAMLVDIEQTRKRGKGKKRCPICSRVASKSVN
jgi:hypothetical protein